MSEYDFLRVLHHDQACQVYEARMKPPRSQLLGLSIPLQPLPQKTFIVKSFNLREIAIADRLLKQAFYLIAKSHVLKCRIVDVELVKERGKLLDFTLNFVFDTQEEGFDQVTLTRDEISTPHPAGLVGYYIGHLLYNNENTQVTVHEAICDRFITPLAIKSYLRSALFELNPLLREGVHQARVAHSHNCRILDIALIQVGRYFQLNLVMERLWRNLLQDIRLRDKSYPEDIVERCLREVAVALLHAREMVRYRQGIAHRDIKPNNILVTEDYHFKLADFGCSWEAKLCNFTVDKVGTIGFMAPEVRVSTHICPFAADVYSLGMTVLYMAVLGFGEQDLDDTATLIVLAQSRIAQLSFSNLLKSVLRKMISMSVENRPKLPELIEEMSEIRSKCYNIPSRNVPANMKNCNVPEAMIILKVLFLGDSSVGKTLLIQKICNIDYKITEDTKTTVGIDMKSINFVLAGRKPARIQLWDSAGQVRFRIANRAFYRGISALILVFDIKSKHSFNEIDIILSDFKQFHTESEKVFSILVGNKCDSETEREVSIEEARTWVQAHDFAYLETSAKTGENVQHLIRIVLTACLPPIDSRSANGRWK